MFRVSNSYELALNREYPCTDLVYPNASMLFGKHFPMSYSIDSIDTILFGKHFSLYINYDSNLTTADSADGNDVLFFAARRIPEYAGPPIVAFPRIPPYLFIDNL